MAANEFEKNMRRMMDEFRIHPSGEVWQKVEQTIARRKRKRRIIFFIAFSCIGLMMAGYGINHFFIGPVAPKQEGQDVAASTGSNTRKSTESDQNTKAKKLNTEVNGNTPKDAAINNKSTIEKPRVDRNRDVNSINKLFVEHKTGAHLKNKDVTPLPGSMKNERRQEQEIADEVKIGNIQKPSPKKDQLDSLNKITRAVVSADTSGNVVVNKKDTILKNSVPDNRVDEAIANIKKAKVRDKSFYAIKWGPTFSGGLSRIAQNSILHTILNTPDKSFNSISYNNPGTAAGGGGSAFANPQSASRSSFAFKAGLVASKNFSKRSSLSIGIQYTYLSDKINTGFRQTSNAQLRALFNISAYYSGAIQQTFTDRFHFIELPVIYDWRITGNTTHFLSIEAGASFSYLVASNALVYDTAASGIYYHNKNQFNYGGVNFISGLSYHARGKKFEFVAGPQFSFSLNDILRNSLDQRKYFLYGGVGANILFGKKKMK